jgi:tRNA uridine 5-carboxymethylaminomethyl modification enzyme
VRAAGLLYTNDRVSDLVRKSIGKSPLYNGQISGIGPRYCPSLEDKIMRFPQRERHQLYLEPEGLDLDEIYVNGFSMSLPRDVQESLVHALPGLEDAVIMRPGYAVEYDFVQPTELKPRSKHIESKGSFSRDRSTEHLGTKKPLLKESLPASMLRSESAVRPRL